VLTFRRDDAPTLAEAINAGRIIDSSVSLLEKPYEIQGGDYSYGALTTEYKVNGGGKVTFNVSDQSGLVQHRNGCKRLTINDSLTMLPYSHADADRDITTNLQSLLFRLSNLQSRIKVSTTIAMAGKMPVGEGLILDIPHVRNPKTGRQNSGEIVGQVDATTLDFGVRPRVSVDVTLTRQQLKGISPSLYIDDWSRSGATLTVNGMSALPGNNDFASTDEGLTDLAGFGCYSYDEERGIYERSCGCSGYACYIIERNSPSLTADAQWWPCTVAAIDPVNATLSLTIGGDYTTFPAAPAGASYVLFFAPRDDAGTQPCQHNYYGYFGDASGAVVDNNGNYYPAITCGG
jgi:hypothetical protein